MKAMNAVALTLVIVGALNWGLVGLLDFNLVAALFGLDSWLSALVYILVGLAGLWSFTFYGKLGGDHARHEHHAATATQPTDLRAERSASHAATPPRSAEATPRTNQTGTVPGEGTGTVPPRSAETDPARRPG